MKYKKFKFKNVKRDGPNYLKIVKLRGKYKSIRNYMTK